MNLGAGVGMAAFANPIVSTPATTLGTTSSFTKTEEPSKMSTASSSFTMNKGAAEFVPKNKIVKTEESFPTLDAIAAAPTKAPAKKV